MKIMHNYNLLFINFEKALKEDNLEKRNRYLGKEVSDEGWPFPFPL